MPGLLRELALAEFVEGRQGRVLRTHRVFPDQAASERLEWTAWTAIVELALRQMVAALPKRPGAGDEGTGRIGVEESPDAAISLTRAGAKHQPRALCIRLAGFDWPGRQPELTGAFHRAADPAFGERDVPWPLEPMACVPHRRCSGTARSAAK